MSGWNYYAAPQYPMPRGYSTQVQTPRTRFNGVVIGVSHDANRDYLVCSSIFQDLVRISRTVRRHIRIGQWLDLYALSENYQGEYVLDEQNSYGYDRTNIEPNRQYAAARFFPSKYSDDLFLGEVLITARFGVKFNDASRKLEYISYDVNIEHLIDPSGLIEASEPLYHGRSFIVEAQASLQGFLILAVTEDPHIKLDCGHLEEPLIPYSLMFFEDTILFEIMTADGYHKSSSTPPASNSQHNFQSPDVPLASSSEPKLGEIDCASSSRPSSETAIRQQTPTTIDASKVEVPEYDSEDDYDEENTALTLGTANIPAKQFLNQLEKKTIERFKMAKGMLDNVQSALCVVVQIIPGGALMFTVKNGVRNVLVLESGCEGLEGPLRLGDVAFFEISMRRTETRDDLLPTAIYSHVAVRRKPTTPLTETKINTFKNSIRTFGGLIEMKVKIRLTERGSVQHFYDDDQTFTKTESERKIFFLTSTNGLLVTIPNERIIELLDENLMAKFDLVAWAVHRKAVGNVCLHIGKDGEAWQKFVDGKLRELPTLSNNYHMNR